MVLLRRSTLPNAITVARIILAPVVFVLLMIPTVSARLLAWFLFLIAAFSDLWDGYLARKHGWISDFGKLVDPIADKLLLVATFVPFYILSHGPGPEGQLPIIGAFPLWILIVVFGRELAVTVLRWIAARRGHILPAGREGKLKAVFQNIFIGTTIFWLTLNTAAVQQGWDTPFWAFWRGFHGAVFMTSLVIAVGLTVYSLFVYLGRWRRLGI